MMNKKKLCIIIVIAIIVTGLAVTFAVLSKSGKHKENVNEETTVNNEKQTDSVTEAAKADERKQVQTSVTMQFKQSNSWRAMADSMHSTTLLLIIKRRQRYRTGHLSLIQ